MQSETSGISGSPFVERRRRMKINLLSMFKNNPDMDEDKVIAIFAHNTGISMKTVREYVEELKMAGVLNKPESA